MRWLLITALLGIAACDAPEEPMRLVTVESPDSQGLSLRELPRATLHSIGLAYGLAEIRLGRAGERAGLRVGDVVYGVNQTRIRNLQDFSKALSEPPDGQPREQVSGQVRLLVRRGKTDLYVPIDLRALRPDGGMWKMPRSPRDTLLRT